MNKNKLRATGIVIGTILALGPFWGAFVTSVGMMFTLDTLGASGVADPQALAQNIGVTLFAAAAAYFACPIGIILLVVSSIGLARTAVTHPSLPSSRHART